MIDHEDTKTWTKQYVTVRRAQCLNLLWESNLLLISYVEQGRYAAAIAGLDLLLNGMIPMQNSGQYGNLWSYLAMLSYIQGLMIAFADPVKLKEEMNALGFQSPYSAERIGSNNRETAVKALEDARDFATSEGLKNHVLSIISALKAGLPAERIRQSYAPDFPEEVPEILRDLNRRFFIPELDLCAPSRTTPTPSRSISPSSPGRGSGGAAMPGKKGSQNFDVWLQENGWDDETLEWAYRRVKLRRNIYGVLTLVTPLGLILFPFWARAMFLTKVFKNRSWSVDWNIAAKLILGLYTIATLFVYMFVMGRIITWTNWGMGLKDKRAYIPTAILAVAAAVWLLIVPSSVSLPAGLTGLPGRAASLWGTVAGSDERAAGAPLEAVDAGPAGDAQKAEPVSAADVYLFPTDTAYIAPTDLAKYTREEIALIRNEIYARYGYNFSDEKLQAYFNDQPWYDPVAGLNASTFDIIAFNEYERANVDTIVKYEREQGWRS